MKFDAKTLRIDSITIIILAILNVVMLIGQLMAEELSVASIMKLADTTQENARIFLIVCICIAGLLYLMTLIVGLLGIRQVAGKYKGKANVVLADILIVLNVISVIACIFYISEGQMYIRNLTQGIIYIAFLVNYVMCAKRVKVQ